MKSVENIIQTHEYKYQVFTLAIKEFIFDSGTSLHFDTFYKSANIYHLKDSRTLNMFKDELTIARIPSIIETIESQISKETYNTLQEIYNQFMRLASQYEYKDGRELDFRTAYGIKDYSEMWENKEFCEVLKKDLAVTIKQLQPIQDLIHTL